MSFSPLSRRLPTLIFALGGVDFALKTAPTKQNVSLSYLTLEVRSRALFHIPLC